MNIIYLKVSLFGEAQRAYFTLSPEQREWYEELRKEILARVGLSPMCAAQLFQDWEYRTLVAPPWPRPPNSHGWRVIGCSPGVPPLAKSPSVSSSTNFFELSLDPSDRQLGCGFRSPSGNSWRPSSWRMLPNTGMLGSECRPSLGGWSRSDARRRAPHDQ